MGSKANELRERNNANSASQQVRAQCDTDDDSSSRPKHITRFRSLLTCDASASQLGHPV